MLSRLPKSHFQFSPQWTHRGLEDVEGGERILAHVADEFIGVSQVRGLNEHGAYAACHTVHAPVLLCRLGKYGRHLPTYCHYRGWSLSTGMLHTLGMLTTAVITQADHELCLVVTEGFC